jgi:hypothetical protein
LTTTCMILVSLILVIMKLVTLDRSYISSEKCLPLPMLLLTPYMALLWVPILYAAEVSYSSGYGIVTSYP